MAKYSILNDNADLKTNTDLELYYFGTRQCSANESWGPGIKNQYKLHYVHSGKGYLKAGDQEYTVTEGQLFACYPNEIVYYRADKQDPWHYSWVAFDGLNSEVYFERAGFSKTNLVIDCPNRPLVETAYNQILETGKSAPNKDLNYMGYLYLILAALIDKSSKSSGNSSSKEYVKEALKYIKKNYSQQITVTDISSNLSLDRKYFSKIFKHYMKMTPNEYLISYRLQKSCELMESTTLTIAEIAATVGYDNQFSFSRAFRKYKNMSPSEYRRQTAKQKDSELQSEDADKNEE